MAEIGRALEQTIDEAVELTAKGAERPLHMARRDSGTAQKGEWGEEAGEHRWEETVL